MTSTLSAAACLLAVALPLGTHAGRGSDAAGSAVVMQLVQIKEVRQSRLSGEESSFDRPGLTLKFALDLPAGARLVELREPTSLKAVDSTGRDLTDVAPGFSGHAEYLDVVHAWEGEPKEATLTLALPRRQAATVSVQAEIEAVVCSGTEVVSLAAPAAPVALNAGEAEFPQARVHALRKGGQVQVIVTPGAVKSWIEDVAIIAAGATYESNAAMWSEGQVVYFIDAPAAPDTVRVTVRRGLRDIPVRLELRDIALP